MASVRTSTPESRSGNPARRGRWRLFPWLLLVVLLGIGGLAGWALGESREPASHGLPRFQAQLQSGDTQPLRVLFYGQSITRQDWWQGVARHLSTRFPERRFEFHNLAVGGHDASRLVRLVDADVLPLQPDLVVFHVYGPPADVRRILQRIRAGTSADVLLANDHLVRDTEVFEEKADLWLMESGLLRRVLSRVGLIDSTSDWQAWRNQEFLPDLADELSLALADVRSGWAQALRDGGRPASDYLADSIHLNARGVALMERLVIDSLDRHLGLVTAAAPAVQAWSVEREITVGPTCPEPLQTTGYRIDLSGPAGLAVKLQVDGLDVDRHPALIEIGRVSELAGTGFPAILQVGRIEGSPGPDGSPGTVAPAQVGQHVLTVGARDPQGHHAVTWRLPGVAEALRGSTREPLRADAAGLVIAPQDWNLAYAEEVFSRATFEGAELRFEVRAPEPVRALTGAAAVMALRFPGNAPHRVCLRVDAADTQRIRVREYHAPFDCDSPAGRCRSGPRP